MLENNGSQEIRGQTIGKQLLLINPFNAKPIFGRRKKKFLGNIIASLVCVLERKVLSSFFFFFFFFFIVK